MERSVLNVEDPHVLQPVSELVRWCHRVFVLFIREDQNDQCTPWTLIGMANYSILEDAVDYCLTLDVWYRGCST